MATQRYRLLTGFHAETVTQMDARGKPIVGANGIPMKTTKRYKPGDVIESDLDLCGMANRMGYAPKFALADRAEGLPETSRVWDSTVETIDEFVARVRGESQSASKAK